jgi:hypothetical protein
VFLIVVNSFLLLQQIPEKKKLIKRKELFWFTVLEVSAQDQLAPLLLGPWWSNTSWQGPTSWLQSQRERGDTGPTTLMESTPAPKGNIEQWLCFPPLLGGKSLHLLSWMLLLWILAFKHLSILDCFFIFERSTGEPVCSTSLKFQGTARCATLAGIYWELQTYMAHVVHTSECVGHIPSRTHKPPGHSLCSVPNLLWRQENKWGLLAARSCCGAPSCPVSLWTLPSAPAASTPGPLGASLVNLSLWAF